MAFIPESDFRLRGKRQLGFEGSDAATAVRQSLRQTALVGQESRPIPQYLTRPDRFKSDQGATVFSNSRTWLNRVAEKPTHDFPAGGKRVGSERKSLTPSPIVTPEYMATITGSVRRKGALEIPDAHLRAIWSEGREAQKRHFATHTADTPSPIPFQNPLPPRLAPIKVGTKKIEGRSDTSLEARPAAAVSVLGFAGMGNRTEAVVRPVKETPTHCVPGSQLPFYGERKPAFASVGDAARR
eukprot:CAMPEP_0174850336 /NCGR_PEP_ID=MMETSP1114-20130205/19174_1 /TAXON_ID=312471 /ORGANISM="Neobodo designis, Strain CCAP 1951/1" /LENGTH=240 /DNA_ID=CAMNT_0016084791 /DNA_START=50 /DNA_END=772 /DNA_ORIENTATION=-